MGLTTVPYLARRVAGGRVRDAFNYDVTGVGIIYVVTVLLIGVAALNTGNNLLYVIVAAMLAAVLVSGLASAIVLRDLELDVRLPEQVFAGRPTLGKIVIRNRRRWLPSFSISVVPIKPKAIGEVAIGAHDFRLSARAARGSRVGETAGPPVSPHRRHRRDSAGNLHPVGLLPVHSPGS